MSATDGVLIGSHVERAQVRRGAQLRDCEVVQLNLSAPQQWAAPKLRGDEEELAAWEVPVFVHAPYLVNCASVRPEQRARSRECLDEQLEACARIGARGLVVHGGHPTGGGSEADGIAGWLEVLDGLDTARCRVLVENTAGGTSAVARHLDALERLFAALRREGHDVGFVLDTCHSWAGGMAMERLVDQVRDAVGEITLVHVNDSKDAPGSGRDRHENLGCGHMDPRHIVEVVAGAGAPCVVETPGGWQAQAADVAWLRQRLAAG